MIRWKKSPLFTLALCALGATLLGEGWVLAVTYRAARAATAELSRKRDEARAFAVMVPAPTRGNTEAIEADLVRATQTLRELRTTFQGRGPAAERIEGSTPPERASDAFFALATFVGEQRERARRAGVGVSAEECFGFAEYARAGPEPEAIPTVYRDRLIAEYLLGVLFDAHPRELLSIQRQRLPGAARATESRSSADYLAWDKGIPRRTDGAAGDRAFRLTFIGDTRSLRSLLNTLAGFELPLVVQAVEVEPADASDGKGGRETRATTEADASLQPSWSRFSVTVEYVEIEPKDSPVS
jgi:hypothetical protein